MKVHLRFKPSHIMQCSPVGYNRSALVSHLHSELSLPSIKEGIFQKLNIIFAK